MIHDFHLPEATLSVVFDPLTSEYRMILLSGCACMCVSMKRELSTTAIDISTILIETYV